MMLIDNRNYLRLHHRPLLEKLGKWEQQRTDQEVVQVEPSRKGEATLKCLVDGKPQYIHSKYDPQTEAERLIAGLDSLEDYNHVLFVGIGLGYHLKELLKKYPNIRFSIYEPNIEVLYQFLSYQDISSQGTEHVQTIFTGTEEEHIRQSMYQMHQMNYHKTFIYTLPAYQKLYAEQEKIIIQTMKKLLKDKRTNLATNAAFQQRWTLNSIKNFPSVLQTPNILHDIDQTAFQGKPAIIVAAGPSLNQEFENLRYIKEHGLAYLFSVGSAINSLIEHGIYPDAACTYDPQAHNYKVINIIKEKGIDEIPLIFGSSVGFETLEDYPGPMLHMITSQDTVAPYYLLDQGEKVNIVNDATSIAIITFQLLKILKCSHIILVGQNLSFKDKQRYAKGINYGKVSEKLFDPNNKNLLTIKDVDGNDIQTSEGYNQMRKQLEMYIASSSNIEIINTTQEGAHIEGTKFISLSDVISTILTDHNIIQSNWYEAKNTYNIEYVEQQTQKMEDIQQKLFQAMMNVEKSLRKIEQSVKQYQLKKLENQFVRFDREIKYVIHNAYFKVFIEPMVRVQLRKLLENNQSIKLEKNAAKKGAQIVRVFGQFLHECQLHIQFVQPFVEELHEQVMNVYEIKVDA